MVKYLALTIISILLLACSPTRMLNGTWTGVGDQIDGAKWDVVLTVKNADINIDYPSLKCGGEWRLVKKPETTIEFKELILFGADKCDQGVEVHVKKISNDKLEVLYYLREYDPTNPVATAELNKVD